MSFPALSLLNLLLDTSVLKIQAFLKNLAVFSLKNRVFDLSGLKASFYTEHSLENVISGFFTIKLTSTLMDAKNWSISRKFGQCLVL